MDRPLVYNPNIDLNDINPNFNISNNQGNGFNNINFESMQNNDMQNRYNYSNYNYPNYSNSNYTNLNNTNLNNTNSNYTNLNNTNSNYSNSNYNQPVNIEQFKKKNKKNHFTNTKKCNNLKTFLRKVIIITLLYVIISHKKMSLLLCNNIPYTCIQNILTYNIIKGIIFGTIIYFTYNYI